MPTRSQRIAAQKLRLQGWLLLSSFFVILFCSTSAIAVTPYFPIANCRKKAGCRSNQIVMGVPSWLDNRGKGGLDSSILTVLQEPKKLRVGVAFWNLQRAGYRWRNAHTW